jgi:hypothetical protein
MGHITNEFEKHRTWMEDMFFGDPVADDKPGLLAALSLMAEQLSVNSIQQVQIIGTFFDAKHQLESQRIFQAMTAEAHKDYHPSEPMCTFGTMTKSLAKSSRTADLTANTVTKRAIERQLLGTATVGSAGAISDQESRLANYMLKYCDPSDNSGNLDLLCRRSANDPNLYNRDINYAETVARPMTLDLNLTEPPNSSEDEQALFALTATLFSNDLYNAVKAEALVNEDGEPDYEYGVKAYMDARAVIAKRSVAVNSISSIAAMKAQSGEEAEPFIYALIKEMSPDEGEAALAVEEIRAYIGDNPSYYAQMKVLSKILYQRPQFYVDLYDKPANVQRMAVAIQAATLMRKRDLYRSYLRSEMTLAVMLETALQNEIRLINNEYARGGM